MNLQPFLPGSRSTNARNIFISYRVQDTAGETGRLVDALKERFDEKHIFIDIEKIEPGLDFSQVISRSLDACDVMLAIIGPNWLGAQPGNPIPRIQSPHDWVRQEISTALKRNIRVIPVLVDGAALPAADQLPDDLTPLLMRQAYEISNKRWKYDTGQLLDFLEKSVGIPPKNTRVPPPPYPPRKERSWLRRNLVWVILVAFLGALIWVLQQGINAFTDPEVQKMAEAINAASPAGSARPGIADSVPADKTAGEGETQEGKAEKAAVVQPPQAPGEQVDPYRIREQPSQVQGTWADASGNFLVVSQSGSSITLKGYNISGFPIGNGSGEVHDGEISFDFNYQVNYVTQYLTFKLTLSPDGRYLNGTQTYQSTGITAPFYLARVQ